MRKTFLYLIVMAVALAMVTAKGGGGGGGSSGGGGGSGGGGATFSIPVCTDAGAITFVKTPREDSAVVAIAPNGSRFTVEGAWDGNTFQSEETQFKEKGRHTLIVDKKNKTFECPGFAFSCKDVSLSIRSCAVTSEGVQALFSIKGSSPQDLEYQFRDARGMSVSHSKKSSSPLLEGMSIQANGADEYILEVKNGLEATKLQISHPKCIGRYYVYSTIACFKEDAGSSAQEESGKKQKCGGYMNIQDRVACRLRLREEQEDEYENFYPEECKSTEEASEKAECLAVYRNIQTCWKAQGGRERMGCVRAKLQLGDIANEKFGCNALGETEKKVCLKELKKKVHQLVKLRLYNLEEEAERYLQDGTLKEQDVIDFVVRMENHKAGFNKAQTNQERKDVILQAKKDWQKLVRGS